MNREELHKILIEEKGKRAFFIEKENTSIWHHYNAEIAECNAKIKQIEKLLDEN